MGLFGKTPEQKPPEPGVKPAPRPPAAPAAATGPARVAPCVIGTGTTIKGEVGGSEDVAVEGAIEGMIRISGDLRVGAGGKVKATVEARSVVVSGELVGDVTAHNKVEILATGRLTGNIRAPKMVIAEGAMFKGNSDMSPRSPDRSTERNNRDKEKDKAAAS
jgi:cytoskeletal protein CcmA (bactofilin family)